MPLSRRKMLQKTMATFGASMVFANTPSFAGKSKPGKTGFSYCLNTSTISGQKLGLMGELDIAAKAGYDGIEIWVRDLDTFMMNGGKTADVLKKASDLGLRIENAISFPKWIVDDEAIRKDALEQAKKETALLAQIGCPRIAAPPTGATEIPGLNLNQAAERYAQLLEVCTANGVRPLLEIWGFSANLNRMSDALFIAGASGNQNAAILADVYHLHKGGSAAESLALVDGNALPVFHMNDYPGVPERESIADKDRIYPGDGIAPLSTILQLLQKKNTPIVLSLELFNRDYWQQDALLVAKTGLEKMKLAVEKALL
ncbi:MAG: sugar phosphate isomerase/epimerase family protein [Cyclobacteriaceae bacterium]|nr:sugar phosphate isomerase/epimerase family protein [Cyclobacteriaceae bacterium]